MRIVAIGDVGVVDDVIHIGDEAMFEALVTALRNRGIAQITGISSNPAESARRYGIDAVSLGEAERVVREADGLVIAGGGNLTSLWPHHISARARLGALAASLGKPLVVTGQTIGPDLTPDDRALVAALLSSARLVGVREASSLALVRALGVDAEHTIDDASYLVRDHTATGDYCLVSLAGHVGSADRDAVVGALATLLDALAEGTGLETVFLPHFASLHADRRVGDSVMHERVAAAMTSPARHMTPTDSVSAARFARGASFVLSSRYHPVVFAVPAGVPTIGIPVDGYTDVKLRGALGNFGQDGVLTVDALLAGEGAAVASGVWARRAAIRENAARLSVEKLAASEAWWDRVVAALR